ncbi:TAXI family TRAP transporter solute-binding subunit [Roseibaca sp. V10]|uniref:TAXI family TRAP transporter solute-binding subunit n=1 Tax=Roseinatronobacter domitianus TaxID=2940293 RepID=A0ABT0M5S0_9RHOB|nr:TAXI family TRAP transporter solute-binding subunit [Roseibaca domitiana]MCL1630201.1 TAXI family TRAP transporter solute-binding subunit [Roseibaca domitiana]
MTDLYKPRFKTKAFALALMTGTALASAPALAETMRFVTSNTGGTFYPIGVAISQVLSENGISVSAEPGGGNSNPISVSQGDAELGFTFAPSFGMAMAGQEPFPAPLQNIRALGYTHLNYTQIAVTLESEITSIPELAGQPFASQGLSAGSSTFFRIALDAYGMTEDDMDIVVRGGPAQGANMVRDRNAVGFHATSGMPSGTFTEAFQSVPMRLLPIEDDAYATISAEYPTFAQAVIPAGTYPGLSEDVQTISTGAVILVRDDMDEELAYEIVRIIAENTARLAPMHGALTDLTPELMASVAGIPLHPGAERYYTEAGLR